MNGLESEKIIGAAYGMDKLLYAVSVGIDALRAGNRITYTTPGRHFFGAAENPAPSRRVRQVQAAFDRARIPWETPADMIRMLWWKFMVNVGINQASVVMRAPFGVFQSSPDARALMQDLMVEVIAVARPAGVDLTKRDVDEWQAMIAGLSPKGKTSMLQDIEAGSKTEVEIFGGTVVALGKTHHIPTPVNQTVLRIIQVLERD